MSPESVHILIELFDCDPAILDDLDYITLAMNDAVYAAGATPLDHKTHRFVPHGITAFVSLKESHLSIHTWPEARYASADFFTCGNCMTNEGVEILINRLRAGRYQTVTIVRGLASGIEIGAISEMPPRF